MTMAKALFTVGEKARVKTTGIEVTISQVSEHGFAIVKFDCGYERMMLVNQLESFTYQAAAYSRKTYAA